MPKRRTTRRSNAFSSHRLSADAALVIAEETKSGGSAVAAPCHTGTAVFASRTAVYPASGNPRIPAPSAAASPTAASGPRRCLRRIAATLAHPPNPASTQLPTLIGEVGRKTRSMFMKRDGRPRSSTRRAALTTAPPAAINRVRSTRPARNGLADQRAAAPNAAEAPARPPT